MCDSDPMSRTYFQRHLDHMEAQGVKARWRCAGTAGEFFKIVKARAAGGPDKDGDEKAWDKAGKEGKPQGGG